MRNHLKFATVPLAILIFATGLHLALQANSVAANPGTVKAEVKPAATATRMVKFSRSKSIGRLYEINKLDDWIMRTEFFKTFIGEARGDLVVPAKSLLCLEVSPIVALQPELLREASIDSISVLRMRAFLEDPEKAFLELPRFKTLKRIDIVNCEVTDKGLASLAALTNLQHLTLTSSSINGSCMQSLKSLKELCYLSLSNNSLVKSAYKDIGTMTNLQFLALSRCRIDDNDMAALAGLTKLTTLRVRNSFALTPKSLAIVSSFKKLEYFDADFTRFKPRDFLQLKGLPLQQIDLPFQSMSATDKRALNQALPKCQLMLNKTTSKPDVEVYFQPLHK